jgi:hypothetical protein
MNSLGLFAASDEAGEKRGGRLRLTLGLHPMYGGKDEIMTIHGNYMILRDKLDGTCLLLRTLELN